MLRVEGLSVSYAGSSALRGVDLEVAAGETVAVIGPNGAGKSTLLKTISGLLKPDAGRIAFQGRDIGRLGPDRIVRLGLVQVPEGRMVLSRMSVRENLLLGGYSRQGDLDGSLAEVLDLFPRLKERLTQLAGSLSGGEQQMLAIGRGLMAAPTLLMLDEPSLGLAPIVIDRIFEVLQDIRGRGITTLLVEQNAERALAASDRAYVFDLGRVVTHGPARALMKDERVREAYLGL